MLTYTAIKWILSSTLFLSVKLKMAGVHQPPNTPILVSFATTDEIVSSLADFIVKAQKDSIDKKGRFTIALSGGSLPKMLKGLIGHPAVKWNKWYADSDIPPA